VVELQKKQKIYVGQRDCDLYPKKRKENESRLGFLEEQEGEKRGILLSY